MSKKRKLTAEEQKAVQERALLIERQLYPDYKIDVFVQEETDDDGQPVVSYLKTKETEMPPGWKP